MNSGILHNLVQATRKTANHPDAGFRFWMAVGLLCSLSLQNDYDGIFIAADLVADIDPTDDLGEMDVPLIRDGAGEVTDILHEQAGYAGHTWVEVAREIALMPASEVRLIAIEMACLRLLVDGEDRLVDLLEQLAVMRRDGLGAEALDPTPAAKSRKPTVVPLVPHPA